MTIIDHIVDLLLETDEPMSEIDPADIVGSVLFRPEDFTIESYTHRFAGYSTGAYSYHVHWKKRTYKGKPIYLGTLGRVERSYNDRATPVAHENEWYIQSVPSRSWEYIPRGARLKRPIVKKSYGYGRVHMTGEPKTYSKYFKHWWQAAAYLARMVVPSHYVKVAETSQLYLPPGKVGVD